MNREKIAKELLKIAEELLEYQVKVQTILNSGVDVRIFEPTEKAPWGTYDVIIGNDVYEMDSNAHLPNGVNIYSGRLNEDFSIEDFKENVNEGLQREVPKSEWERLPHGLLQGIIDRIGELKAVDEDDEFGD